MIGLPPAPHTAIVCGRVGEEEPMTRFLARCVFAAWWLAAVGLVASCGSGAEKAEEYLKKGNALVAEGKHEAAIAEFKKAAELNKDSVEALILIGDAYRTLKKYDEALAAYSQAKKAVRSSAKPYLASARLQMETGHVDSAVADLDQVTELDPGNLEGMLLQGKVSMMPRALPGGGTGVPDVSLERARLNLETVVQKTPDNVEARYWLARLYEKLGKKDEAFAAWSKVRELAGNKPEHAEIAPEIAEALERLKR